MAKNGPNAQGRLKLIFTGVIYDNIFIRDFAFFHKKAILSNYVRLALVMFQTYTEEIVICISTKNGP